MFQWLGTGKGYITVFYNLGLMLVLGTVLHFLMENIAELFGFKARQTGHFDDEAADTETK